MPDGAVLDGLTAVRLRHDPDLPAGFHHHQVRMPLAPGVDAQAVAVQLTDGPPDPDALVDAVVRHWAGEDHGQLDVVDATAAELRARGVPLLDLSDLRLVAPDVLARPGCPLVRVDDRTRTAWAAATRHRADGTATAGRVPYAQAVVRWLDTRPDLPVAHPMNMAGLGAGHGHAAALEAACRDVAAQDAAWTWWSDSAAPAPVRVAVVEDVARAWGGTSLALDLRRLPSPLGVPVVLAVVDDGDVATLAVAAGPDHEAQPRAAARALWQLVVARDLADPDGSLVRSAVPGLPPHRPDRDYLDAAGPGQRRLVDPLAHVQLTLDPAVRTRLRARLGAGRTAPVPATAPPAAGGAGTSGSLPATAPPHGCARATVLAAGRDVWVVDLTTAEVAAAGWRCVRVLAPGTSRLPVGAFPPDPAVAEAAARALGREPGPAEAVPWPGW
ncbi:YcaO-like family protein [Cellulomonas sp.]|uniref:YcaO-like family protein n=1 Tax=Cellulomonas sp. TaxID=40001 RepID=UPI0028127F4D|nr:YcaO-like family protein [Cellulomonas sp.]